MSRCDVCQFGPGTCTGWLLSRHRDASQRCQCLCQRHRAPSIDSTARPRRSAIDTGDRCEAPLSREAQRLALGLVRRDTVGTTLGKHHRSRSCLLPQESRAPKSRLADASTVCHITLLVRQFGTRNARNQFTLSAYARAAHQFPALRSRCSRSPSRWSAYYPARTSLPHIRQATAPSPDLATAGCGGTRPAPLSGCWAYRGDSKSQDNGHAPPRRRGLKRKQLARLRVLTGQQLDGRCRANSVGA